MQTLSASQAIKQSNDKIKYIKELCRKHPTNPVFKNKLALKKVTKSLIKKGFRMVQQ